MQGVATSARPEQKADQDAAVHETAARVGALLRHLFMFDRGEHLRAIESSGLSLTQVKALLLLRGVYGEDVAAGEPAHLTDLASALGVSVATVSRAVDALVRKKLVTRVEDAHDRRVRRVAATAKGEKLAAELVATRMAGLEQFAAGLTAAQRRKLDAAVESLMDDERVASAYRQLKKVRA